MTSVLPVSISNWFTVTSQVGGGIDPRQPEHRLLPQIMYEMFVISAYNRELIACFSRDFNEKNFYERLIISWIYDMKPLFST